MPWHACVLWLSVPFFCSWGLKMPDIEAEEAALERILRGLHEHAERIDDAIASENFPLAWHEIERFKAFLDGELG